MSVWTTTSWVAVLFVLAATARHRHPHYPTTTISGGTMCPNCLLRNEEEGKYYDRSEAIRLEAIKHQILSKLGLRARPNVSGASMPRDLVLETLYRANDGPNVSNNSPTSKKFNDDHDMGRDDFFATTSEIITFPEPGPRLNGQRLIEFLPPGEGPDLRVKSAVLWVRLEQRSYSPPRNVTLWVIRLTAHHLPNTTQLSGKDFNAYTEVVSSARVSTIGWHKLDLQTAVTEWYSRKGSRKLSLLIDCSGCGSAVAPALFQSGRSNKPYLVVRTEPAQTRRVRRTALECSGAPRGHCCKQQFYVNFKEIGWDDWVIAPGGYFANYCRGDCNRHRTPDTYLNYHTHIMEEFRKKDLVVGLQPCCSPIRFSPATLIYYTPEKNIVKTDLPKMVIEECGCP
ncbi:inhibin beta chain isoform X2 [Cimex lectularius]|uniref:TGF-beta family profile domain-containing protein n=1 Tax=Cimex lectularius TaxID=79782 RepID=A0A8I6SG02_CIMLE|nr:inhibin beta chain isoform X2 [Cimex lectularius]